MHTLPAYEELAHTADLRLRAWGATWEKLFIHAAQGMVALMRYPADTGGAPVELEVEQTSLDLEATLVDWLGELLYLADEQHAQWTQFEIGQLAPGRIVSRIRGMTPAQPGRVIKAVTYHAVAIHPSVEGWDVTLTFDV
jgi:SHS2 domain-containing protein